MNILFFQCGDRLSKEPPADEWHDTALQTQDAKFESWLSEAEHVISRARSLLTILNLNEWAGNTHVVSLKLEGQRGVQTRDFRLSKETDLTTTPGSPP